MRLSRNPCFFGTILFVLLLTCTCRKASIEQSETNPLHSPSSEAVESIESVEAVESIESIETLVVGVVEKCGGLIVRDTKTGRITEVDVAANRSSIDDAAFAEVVRLTGLKKLSLSGGSLTGESLQKLETLTLLEELSLIDTITSDSDLASLCQKLKKLRRLTLRRLNNLSDQGLEAFHTLKELRNLALLNLSIGEAGLDTVSSLSSLRALDLRGCNQLRPEDYQLLAKMTALTDLKIGGASVNAEVLRMIASLPNLTSLTVEDTSVSVEVWEELFTNPQWTEKMTSLAFARVNSLNDRVLEKLSGFKKLKTLSLRALFVRGSFVANLAPDSPLLTNLHTLGMTKNYATPEEILQLKRFKNLKKLDFSATLMTLEKVEALCTLDQIEVLVLIDCQLTDEMREKLDSLETLVVIHE